MLKFCQFYKNWHNEDLNFDFDLVKIGVFVIGIGLVCVVLCCFAFYPIFIYKHGLWVIICHFCFNLDKP